MKTKILALLILLTMSVTVAHAESAQALYKRVTTAATSKKVISATFAMSGDMGSVSGTLKVSGSKFVIKSAVASTWYNGKDMWTYNASNNETSLMTPTAAEVAEVNPLSYIHANAASFVAEYAKTQPTGCKALVLTPKKGVKNGLRRAVLTVNAKTLAPTKLVVSTADNKKITIVISAYSSGNTVSASDFEYPKQSYPKAKIIDLR